MKIKFNCDSGANIHSCRTSVLDTVKDLGYEDGEWESLSEEEQQRVVMEWAWDRLSVWWEPA